MTSQDLQDMLVDLLSEQEEIDGVVGYRECGMLTRDKGVVVETACGKTFQITIVRD